MPEFKPYSGGEMCHHGREVLTDDDECPYEGTHRAVDDSGEFILCGKHHQRFVGAMATNRAVGSL